MILCQTPFWTRTQNLDEGRDPRHGFQDSACLPRHPSRCPPRSILGVNRMVLLDSIVLTIIIHGLLFAWLVEAQTETVYLTQIKTLYSACVCPDPGPSGLSVSVASAVSLAHAC